MSDLWKFAIGYGAPETKPDYYPPTQYMSAGQRLGHFLFYHFEVLKVECTAYENQSFRERLRKFNLPPFKVNLLLGIYLYCRDNIKNSSRSCIKAKELKRDIAEIKSTIDRRTTPKIMKSMLKGKLSDLEFQLDMAQSIPHRRSENTYRDAVIYVLHELHEMYQTDATPGQKVEFIGEFFTAMFQTPITRSMIEKVLYLNPPPGKPLNTGWSI